MKGFARKVAIFLLAVFWPMHGYSEQELTLDVSHYLYEEEVNGAFFMKDEAAPAFISLGLRDWEGQQGPNSETSSTLPR